jgi:signal transduction histidine kinase
MPDGRGARLERLGRWPELGLAVAFLTAAVAEQLARPDSEHSLRAVAWVLAIGAPVLVRRTQPLAGASAASVLLIALPHDLSPSLITYLLPLILSYSLGAHAPPGQGFAGVVALAAAFQVHLGFSEAPNLEIAITTVAPWWAGLQVRRRRQLVSELMGRTRELEIEEESFVQLAVQRERARITRDLHDIVSHHLAVMVIQAGAGRLATTWQSEIAAERFATIREAGTQALAETEQLVTMLQADEAGAPRLSILLRRAQAAGARVVQTPPDPELPPAIEAGAYRVVQEALTNAMKHAPGAAIDVAVRLGSAELEITVRNDSDGAASAIARTGSGLGLSGMCERLAAFGGSLEAGFDAEGSFRLRARLPLAPAGTIRAQAPATELQSDGSEALPARIAR